MKRIHIITGILMCLYTSPLFSQSQEQRADQLYEQGEIYEAIDIWKKAYASANEGGRVDTNMVIYLNKIGNAYTNLDDNVNALQAYIKAYHHNIVLKDSSEMAGSLANIGHVHIQSGNDSLAKVYLERCVDIAQKTNNTFAEVIGRVNIAILLLNQDKRELSIATNNLAIEKLKSLDSLHPTLGRIYSQNTLIYLELSQFEEAELEIQKALVIANNAKDNYLLGFAYARYGQVLLRLKKYAQAIEYALKAEEVATDIHNKSISKLAHYVLAETYEAQKEYKKAIEYHKKMEEDIEALKDIASDDKLKEMEAKFRFNEKEKEIRILTQRDSLTTLSLANKELKLQKASKKNQLLTIFTIALVMVSALLILMYRNKKKYSEELLDAKEYAEKQEEIKNIFLSNTSHELRAPLHSIIGNSELLQLSSENGEKLIQNIQYSSKHLLQIVNDILDLSKIESGTFQLNKESFGLREELLEIVTMVRTDAEEKGLELDVMITNEVPQYIVTDLLRFRQVVLNLLTNAIKFTQKGAISVSIFTKNKMLHIHVKDTGRGMSEAQILRVFKPYIQESTDVEGTGLGLSITSELVRLMKGTITVDSVLQEGSTFKVEIPLLIGEPTSRKNAVTKGVLDLSSFHVITVDDNPMNLQVTGNLLSLLNASPLLLTGAESIDGQLSPEKHNIVLLDMQLQNESGIDMTKKLREHLSPSSATIIGASGNASPTTIEEAINMGMNNYLIKPFSLQQLNDMLIRELPYYEFQSEKEDIHTSLREDLSANIQMFTEEVPIIINELKTALELKNEEETRFYIHKLKPCFFYIDEMLYYDNMQTLEKTFGQLSFEQIIPKVEQMINETNELLVQLKKRTTV